MKRAACAIVIEDGEVLAVSRRDNPNALGFPGGKAELLESLDACAVRELREETGIVTDTSNLEFIFTGTDSAECEVTTFLVRRFDGRPSSQEGQRVEFVPWSELTGSTATWPQYNRLVQEALEQRYSIPKVSRRYVEHVLGWVSPIVTFGGRKSYIRKCDPFDVAYTWDPKRKRTLSKMPALVEVARIRTLHRYSYYGFFKPSLAEVVAQIPADWVHEIDAFEIVESPQTTDDLNRERYALNKGYHVATTALYKYKREQ